MTFGAVSTNTTSTMEGEADIDLSNTGGNLDGTVGTSVTALGLGDISYTTTSSGNIVLTGTTTALATTWVTRRSA